MGRANVTGKAQLRLEIQHNAMGVPDEILITDDGIREYQGVEYAVTVTRTGYEYAGQPYKSLSAIARAITGTRWNGRVFFGLRSSRGLSA